MCKSNYIVSLVSYDILVLIEQYYFKLLIYYKVDNSPEKIFNNFFLRMKPLRNPELKFKNIYFNSREDH